MEFSVLNKQTLKCIMTEKEIEDYGMDRQALLQNDGRVQEFFRRIMHQAQEATGFQRRQGNVAVQASFLTDERLEITFSVDSRQEAEEEKKAVEIETAVFKSRNIPDMIQFCKLMPEVPRAELYQCSGNYFLLADLADYTSYQTAVLFNLADEYIEAVCYTKSIVVHIREHGTCMLEKDAAQIMREL